MSNQIRARLNFTYPRSLVGRSILALFAAPFISSVLFYLLFMVLRLADGLLRLVKNMYMYFTRPEWKRSATDELMPNFHDSFFGDYVVSLGHSLSARIADYFAEVLVVGFFTMFVYIVYRFLRSRQFGKAEYCRIWTLSLAIFFAIPPLGSLYYYVYPMEIGGEPMLITLFDVLRQILFYGIVILALVWFVRFIFLKRPYHTDGLWQSEMSAKEFFGNNYEFFKTKLMLWGWRKIAFVIMCLVILDMLAFTASRLLG